MVRQKKEQRNIDRGKLLTTTKKEAKEQEAKEAKERIY